MADRFGRINADDTVLLVIDIQEKFVPHINGIDAVIQNSAKAIRGCRELGVPVVVTEQYPEGLGHTVPQIAEALGEYKALEKTSFSIFGDEAISAELKKLGRVNLLLCGIESHVCLLKTALDALDAGYAVHWLLDCISSRTPVNAEAASRRVQQCGGFISSAEMALFQLMGASTHQSFRAISKIVR